MKSAALRHPARLAGASLLRLQSDARLAELALAGHEAAFDAIVDRYRTPLLRYCAGIVGPSRAEDAVQQTLINAHEAMTRTDEVRHLKSWLYRIAHNASLNVLRAVRDDVPLDEAALGARAGSGAAGPDESFERTEQFRETLAAVQALPERQRAALVLRELEGRSHEEIAAALGVTKGSARQHLMRARVAVRSAVTAITPYPLIARFAEILGGGSGPGWVDAAAGAGASATLMKLGAGVAATGALVGGAVGTQHAVREGSREAAVPRAAEKAAGPMAQRARAVVVAAPGQAAGVVRASLPGTTGSGPHAGERSSERGGPRKHKHPSRTPTPVSPAPPSGPAATVPAVEPATTRRGRDDADEHHGRGGKRHGGRGTDDRTTSSAHGRDDQDERRDRHGNDGRQKHGSGNDTPSTPSDSAAKGEGEGKGKDDTSTPATPTTDDRPTPSSGSKGSSSDGSGSGSDSSGSSDGATTPTTTAPTTSTSTTPATTTSGDED